MWGKIGTIAVCISAGCGVAALAFTIILVCENDSLRKDIAFLQGKNSGYKEVLKEVVREKVKKRMELETQMEELQHDLKDAQLGIVKTITIHTLEEGLGKPLSRFIEDPEEARLYILHLVEMSDKAADATTPANTSSETDP